MGMTRLTALVLRHRLLVVVFWLVVAVAGGLTVGTTTGRLSQSFAAPGSPAQNAADRILAAYHVDASADPDVVVVTVPTGQTADSPSSVAVLRQVFAAVRPLGLRSVDVTNTSDARFTTADHRTAYGIAYLPPGGVFDNGLTARLTQSVQRATPAGYTTAVTGLGPLQTGSGQSGGLGLLAETLIGAAGALLVLIFVFASFVAVLPLVMAGISILTTFLLLLGLTAITEVNFIAQFIIGLIGLGVAIDYALLVVTRWREERAHGADNRIAVEKAMAHAGRAVVFSGLTVTVGLLVLAVLPIPSLRSFGYAGALIPLVSVAVAITLLPVLLDTIGPRLDWPRIRNESRPGRGWIAWARAVVRWRWAAMLAGVAVLLALAIPVLSIQLGEARSVALSQPGPARQALNTLTVGGVPSGMLTPIVVLADQRSAPAVVRRLDTVAGVATVGAPADQRSDGTALITVLPRREAGDDAGKVTVQRVRDAVAGDPGVLGVAGEGAGQLDFRHAVYGRFPYMLGIVCLITFLLLARAFRSLVLPAKAVLLNLVSLGAAYGVLVVVWQNGYGSEALWNTPSTGAIAIWIPLIVFAFLFGLSMDYEVFLLARMREAYDAGADTDGAVVTGLSRTGRLVTCAALILVLAFLSLSTAPATDVRVLATGLGAGILVDATVVRCLLVPSLVSLFGRWNWWMPAWAARVLRVPPPDPRDNDARGSDGERPTVEPAARLTVGA
jgi:putative drug exporter of the RND superfamily